MASAFINAAISLLFYLAVFGFAGEVVVPGWKGFAFDFIPQSLAVGLMAALVPGLLARRRICTGGWSGAHLATDSIAGLLLIVAAHTAAALAIGGGVAGLLVWTDVEALAGSLAAPLKILYGAALGASVTHLTLRRYVATPAPP